MRINGKVAMRGFIERNGHNAVEFPSGSAPLGKALSIFFLAKPEGIDRPYEIQWQVVNTGKEAEDCGQLRGDFYLSSSSTSHKRKEGTLYTGTHWIEVFVIKDGVCVARSGEFVVNIT